MRILVDNSGYELLNLGDVGMLQVGVSRLRKLWPEARITVMTRAPDRLARYCPGTIPLSPEGREVWLRKSDLFGSLHKLIPSASVGLYAFEARLRRRFPLMMRKMAQEQLHTRGCDTRAMIEFSDALFEADLVVGTGGGYLTDSFAEHAMDILETLHLAQRLGISTALLGQGLGPVSQDRVWNPMMRVLPRLDLLTLREGAKGIELARKAGVDAQRVFVTGDDGVRLAHEARSQVWEANVGVNVRTAWYAYVPPAGLEMVSSAIRSIGEDHRLIGLPVSAQNDAEDARAIAQILGRNEDPIDQPSQLIDRISTCRLVITGSYHAGVFALAQGIPVIGLVSSYYYWDKFIGLADCFGGVGCAIVDLHDPQAGEKLRAEAQRLIEQAPSLRPALLKFAEQQMRAGEDAYRLLALLVEGRRALNGHACAAHQRAGSGL